VETKNGDVENIAVLRLNSKLACFGVELVGI
jgi:hypothetical protein